MDKALRPSRFESLVNTTNSSREFNHWLRTFEYYLEVLPEQGLNKLRVLTNFGSPDVKAPNVIYACHRLSTRRQQPVNRESIGTYVQALKLLAKDCNFEAVTAKVYQEEAIRNAFISGILSNEIRQRLL